VGFDNVGYSLPLAFKDVITNGGFAEYIAVPEKNVFKIPDNTQWELAASIPVTTLTPYPIELFGIL
jgi:NADPH:quinone reductase-like Zn-dependent oxidoreductase